MRQAEQDEEITVRELIKLLKGCNPKAKVWVACGVDVQYNHITEMKPMKKDYHFFNGGEHIELGEEH